MPGITDDEKAQRWTKKIIFVLFILGFLLIVVGFIGMKLTKPLILKPQYNFEIEALPTTEAQLRDFQLYYDFSNDFGKIYFRLSNTNVIETIRFTLPTAKIEEVIWSVNCTAYKKGCKRYDKDNDFDWNTTKDAQGNIALNIYNYNNSLKEGESTFNITFNANLDANANIFLNPTEPLQVIAPAGDQAGIFFTYRLGDKYYSCESCAENYPDYNLLFDAWNPNEDNTIHTISVSKNQENEYMVKTQYFNLHYTKKSIWDDLVSYGKTTMIIDVGIALPIFFVSFIKARRKGKRKIKEILS